MVLRTQGNCVFQALSRVPEPEKEPEEIAEWLLTAQSLASVSGCKSQLFYCVTSGQSPELIIITLTISQALRERKDLGHVLITATG